MPKKQDILKTALLKSRLAKYSFKMNKFDIKKIRESEYNGEILNVYRKLGGIQTEYPYPKNGFRWDMIINGLIIEFDEEQHFNRYRLITLDSPIYEKIGFPIEEYIRYCRNYENKCWKKAKHGRYWISETSKQQFGIGSLISCLDDVDSPRWKQRAFYDFLKDVGCYICGLKMVRIPVYLNEYQKVAKSNYDSESVEELVDWILSKINSYDKI